MEVIENASHMVMMEKPEKVNEIIHDFILQTTPTDVSIRRTNTKSREALKKKPWLRRAFSKSKSKSSVEPAERKEDSNETLRSGTHGPCNKPDLDRKESSMSLRSVKSLPHDLVMGNLTR